MRGVLRSLLVCLVLGPPLAPAHAQIVREPLEEARSRIQIPPEAGIDLEHGWRVVMGLEKCLGTNCMPCFQCHSAEGQGSHRLAYPRLAGQTYRYLYNSLRDFASGRRTSAVMTPIAQALSPEAWRDAAAYYSLQKIEGPETSAMAAARTKANPETLAHGSMIANVGIPERGVQACVNCHGPQGAGMPPVYPYLAGQYADYLQQRLMAWKTGKVAGDGYGFGVMEEIAQRLTEGDIHAVSQYFFAIVPPRIVREENYAGPLELGVPLGRQRELRGEDLSRGRGR